MVKKTSLVSNQSAETKTSKFGNLVISNLEIASTFGGEGTSLETTLRMLRNRAMPKTAQAQFKKAKHLREENDLIGILIDTQVEFAVDGFHIYTPNKKARKYYEDLQDEFNLDGLVDQMFEDLCIHSNTILHWKVKPSGDLDYVIVLDPCDVIAQPFFGNKSLLWVQVPDFIKKLINTSNLNSEEQKLADKIPKKFKDALKNKSGITGKANMALLNEADGEYWEIINLKGFIDRLVPPSMKNIFDDIEHRNLLKDGDFSVAYFIKNIIMQVSTGESISNGPKAGSTQNWPTNEHLGALEEKFQLTGNAMAVFTDHVTKIQFIIPDTKVFDPAKFTTSERNILRWGGIGEIVLTGTGGNFSSGFINIKRLTAKVKRYRQKIKLILKRFFSHPTIKGSFSLKHIPEIFFDDDLLQEAKISLAEKQFLVDRGGISLQTVMRKAGYNPDVEEINKQEELDKEELYLPKLSSLQPIHANYGLDGSKKKFQAQNEPGEPGRPGNEQPSHGETTLNAPQNPRPSTASDTNDDFIISRSVLKSLLELDDPEKEIAVLGDLPAEGVQIWESVYQNCLKEGDTESFAARKAWASVKKSFKKEGSKWTKKKTS